MKTLAYLAWFASACALAFGQQNKTSASAQPGSRLADEAAIRALMAENEAAANDPVRAAATYAPDGYVWEVNRPRVTGTEELRRHFAAHHGAPGEKVRSTVDAIRFLGPDVALVDGTATSTIGRTSTRSTANLVVVRRDTGWKIAAAHVMKVERFGDKPPQAASTAIAPPQDQFTHVNGVRLHYLDWGGEGDVLLFLPGLTQTAHAFNGIAPAFTERYHVMGLTRRGHGASEKPAGGYDLPTLTEDVVAFLNSIEAKRVVLVGHSFAGLEMPALATRLGNRVAGLVLLDAIYDWSALDIGPTANYFKSPDDSWATFEDWHRRRFPNVWGPVFAAHLRSNSYLSAAGRVEPQLPKAARDQLWDTALKGTDYSGIRTPVLVIWANEPEANVENMKSFGYAEADLEIMRRWSMAINENKQRGIDALRKSVPALKVVEMKSPHWVFWHRPEEVTRAIRQFLASL